MKKILFGSLTGNSKLFNLAWALFRMYAGLSLAAGAGLPKITATGSSPDWFIKQVAELGFTFPSPSFWATLASWGEFLGGLLLTLGLLTRFAAFQLAFQFFVIAFLWYNEPALFVGMYYQQLLFWVYIVITAGGGGTFSLDYLMMKWKKDRSKDTE